ncbi:MAG TPA: hypothetical protein VM285_17050 [Polyangia bacterium]|nr:hypothetical protein [Polyangia bacterium]
MSGKKTEDRPYMGLGVFQPEGDAAPGTTIVGGQPDGRRHKGVVSVPVGLEQLLYTAATDAAFRAELVRDRERAAARRGLALTDSERSALAVAPRAQLEAMIDHIDTSEQNLKRCKFMRAVAATVVTLAASTGLGACGGPTEQQANGEAAAPFQGPVETPQVELPRPEPAPPAGIRPDAIPEPFQLMAGLMAGPPDPSVPPAAKPAKKPAKKPQVDVEPPDMPTRGHTGGL